MDIYAKGQLSFLILNCLLERDFYGLDIITEIRERTNGKIDLKKPSVYSNLTRMEKQGLVSSYLQSSDLGPNRRYYSITERGRKTHQELKEEFERNHFDVFRDFGEAEDEPIAQPILSQEQPASVLSPMQEDMEEDEEEMDGFFDFSSLDSPKPSEPKQSVFVQEEVKEEPVIVEPVIEEALLVTEPLKEPEPVQEVISTPATEESVPYISPLKAQAQETKQASFDDPDYNKRIYDITKDFNKYRRKRSFAEDQLAFDVKDTDFSLQDSEAKRQEKIEVFKSALLESKGRFGERMAEEEFKKPATPAYTRPMPVPTPMAQEEKEEEKQDDGVFITNRVERENVMRTRKIEPPRLKIVNENPPLPAPKRDASIDPSHKEIISQLYSKSKGSDTVQEELDIGLYDYDDLSDYYNASNISFKTYEQNKAKTKHNTNKLNMIASAITFTLLCIFSSVLFAVLYTQGLTNPNTSFLYIIIPGAYFIDVCAKLSALKNTSWEPKPMLPQWFMWLMTLLTCGVVVGLNFLFGMNIESLSLYYTTLILPIVSIIAVLPFRYYVKRNLFIRKWK